ncbi:MAG: hypothetical protein U5N55_07925 [Cypionkella sp.]|nr:hypothetical protein [Cypionkella sp.]
MTMNTAEQLAALTERLSNHIDVTEKALQADRAERQLAAAERQAILSRVNELHRDMQDVKPVTDMVSSLRAKVSGGIIVLGFIGAVAWTGILFFKEQITDFLTGG